MAKRAADPAETPIPDAPQSRPEPVEELIEIASIRIRDRLRDVDLDNVDMLAVSMAERGLGSPIWVRRDKTGFALIAGAHRTAAGTQLGWTQIKALIFDVDALEARMMEIDENLFRRDLSELDRAISLAERKRLYEARHPEARHGGDRRSDQGRKFETLNDEEDEALIPGFARDTAKKLGINKSTVFRSIARAKIDKDVRRLIATTWIATKGAALDALARLPEAEQMAAAELMLEEGGPRTVAEAVARIKGQTAPQKDAAGHEFNALLKAWRRAGQRARDQFVEFLRDEGALDGLVLAAPPAARPAPRKVA
jgi:ParB family chromosome partitioning protein